MGFRTRIGRRSNRAVATALGADWIGPLWWERQGDPNALTNLTDRSWTMVGTAGSHRDAVVDRRGLITPWLNGWSVDWWIGAEDRWHFPSREDAVRQRLVESTPVVETAMRVPGGDAVQRAYAARSGEDVLVVEIENCTPTPFAVAIAVRPYNAGGVTTVEQIELRGRTVLVDGNRALIFPKEPARMAGGTSLSGDSAATVTAGAAGTALPDPLRCDAGLAQAAFLFPLPHRATLRMAMPLSAADDASRRGRRRRPSQAATEPESELPSATSVAAGWRALTNRGMRLELPESRLADAVEANRRFLLLCGEDPMVLMAMQRYGFVKEADQHLASAPRRRWRRRDDSQRERGRDPSGAAVLGIRPELQAAAADLRAGDRNCLERLQAVLAAASDTFGWGAGHDQRAIAAFLLLVRDLLVREVSEGLALCSMVPEAWVGQPIEVHDAPTEVGVISFALRWHDERPALLWDLRPEDGVGPIIIRAPGLDPTWRTSELRGDTLLNAVPLEPSSQ